MGGENGEKRGPEFLVRFKGGEPNRLKRETPFLCHIAFRNDLPAVPSDPKLLLPPFNPQELAAFQLTELEKDLKKDMLFEPDLGIPIHPWNVEQYSVPEHPPPLHPADAALLAEEPSAAGGLLGAAAARSAAAEVSWLLRTKYISGVVGGEGRRPGSRQGPEAGGAEAAAAAAAAPLSREAQLAAIERGFAAAARPPVHHADPSLRPLEVLSVFPDDLLRESRDLVLTTFDNDPTADVERLEALPADQRALAAQVAQLKSFKHTIAGGREVKFVAYLVPTQLPEVDGEPGSGGVAASALEGEYEWVREYNSTVRYDPTGQTYVFRFGADRVMYAELSTRLALRKRKRQQASFDEEEEFQQPERVFLRRWEGPEAGQEEEEEREGGQDGAEGQQPQQQEEEEMEEGPGQQQQEHQEEEVDEGQQDGQQAAASGEGSGEEPPGGDVDMPDADDQLGDSAGQQQGAAAAEQNEDGGGYQGAAAVQGVIQSLFGSDDDDD